MRILFRPIGTDWPGELSAHRKESQFTGDWASTKEVLEREVSHLMGINPRTHYGPADLVLQLAVPEGAIRQDGGMRAGSKAPEHPGVIVNVEGKDGPLRFACDRFDSRWKGSYSESWRHNVRAIALGLEALRKVERYGLGTGTEQYVGFQALPPGTPMPAAAMTFGEAVSLLGMATAELGARDALRDGRLDPHEAWKLAAKLFHPDVAGGTPEAHEQWLRLTEARDVIAAQNALRGAR